MRLSLLILRLRNYFAKPQQHRFYLLEGILIHKPANNLYDGRRYTLSFGGYEMRQEGLKAATHYIVSNKPITGAKVFEYQGHIHHDSYVLFGTRAAVGLRFCVYSFEDYFPVLPLKLYVKEDHV